jgi:hypothetical protein
MHRSMNPNPGRPASKRQDPSISPRSADGTNESDKEKLIMYRTESRISLPAVAVAAFIALCVTGGTAALFQYGPDEAPADIHTLVASTPSEALPMREIVPNRIDVIAVREPERVSAIVAPRERS